MYLILTIQYTCQFIFQYCFLHPTHLSGLPRWLSGKEFTCQCRCLIPGSERSPEKIHGNLFYYCSLGDPVDRGAFSFPSSSSISFFFCFKPSFIFNFFAYVYILPKMYLLKEGFPQQFSLIY